MTSLFNEPVRAHVDRPGVELVPTPCLWTGMSDAVTAIIVMGDGQVQLAGIDDLTADWRHTGSKWEDLQEAIEGVDPEPD